MSAARIALLLTAGSCASSARTRPSSWGVITNDMDLLASVPPSMRGCCRRKARSCSTFSSTARRRAFSSKRGGQSLPTSRAARDVQAAREGGDRGRLFRLQRCGAVGRSSRDGVRPAGAARCVRPAPPRDGPAAAAVAVLRLGARRERRDSGPAGGLHAHHRSACPRRGAISRSATTFRTRPFTISSTACRSPRAATSGRRW